MQSASNVMKQGSDSKITIQAAIPLNINRATLRTTHSTPSKDISWFKIAYHFFQLKDDLSTNANASLDTIKMIVNKWKEAARLIHRNIGIITDEINKMTDQDEDVKNSRHNLHSVWKSFNIAFLDSIQSIENLVNSFSDNSSNEKTIAANFNKALMKLPSLFTSFDDLQLNTEIKKFLPTSIDELKKSLHDFAKIHIENIIPSNLWEKIDAHLSIKEKLTAAQFSKLTPNYQDMRLVALQELIEIFKDIYLRTDKLEIHYSIKKGYLLTRKFTFLHDQSLDDISTNLSNTYSAYLGAAGYKLKNELHPYSNSLNIQREKMLEVATSNIEQYQQSNPLEVELQSLNKISIEKISQKIIELDKMMLSFRDFIKKQISYLKELSPKLNNSKLHQALIALDPKTLPKELPEELKTFITRLHTSYLQLDTRKAQRFNSLVAHKSQILKRLPANRKMDDKPKSTPRVVHFAEHFYKTTIPTLTKNIKHTISLFTQEAIDIKSPDSGYILNLFDQLDQQLKKALDPIIYRKLFSKQPSQDSKSIVILPTPSISFSNSEYKDNKSEIHINLVDDKTQHSQDMPSWIENFASTITTLKSILMNLAGSNNQLSKRADNPIDNMIQSTKQLESLSDQLTVLLDTSKNLKEDPFIRQFTSLPGLKNFLTNISQSLIKHTESITNNAIKHTESITNNASESKKPSTVNIKSEKPTFITRILSLYDYLDKYYTDNKINNTDNKINNTDNKINNTDNKINNTDNKINNTDKASFDILLAHLSLFVKGIESFTSDPYKALTLTDWLKFLFRQRDVITFILKSIPEFIANNKKIGLRVLEEINLFLQDIFLIFDNLETFFYLKQGFLSQLSVANNLSFADLTREYFHKPIKNAGYSFNNTSEYPYFDAIQKQRSNIYKDSENDFDIEFIKSRMDETQKIIEDKKKYQNLEESLIIFHDKKSTQIDLNHHLNERINQLTSELKKSNSPTKSDKKDLLKQLLNEAKDKKNFTSDKIKTPYNIDTLIDNLNSSTPNSILNTHLLFEGRTGKAIQALKYQGATKKDVLDRLDLAIEQLKRQRQESFYYSSITRRQHLETKICGLTELRKSLLKSGYTMEMAFNELGASSIYSEAHTLLKNENNNLLRELDLIDKHISIHLRGTVIIDNSQPATTQEPISQQSLHMDHKHIDTCSADKILNSINERISILQGKFFKTHTVNQKIDLLTKLKTELKKSSSLSSAVEKIRNKHQHITFLLFEGETGKMMKELELCTLSKDDMIRRIELEIVRLKEQRFEKLYFFSDYRKKKLIKTIHALTTLKSELSKCATVEDALKGLNPEQLSLVNSDPIITDLKNWDEYKKDPKLQVAPNSKQSI